MDARWKIEPESWHLEEAIGDEWASVDAYWRQDLARKSGQERQARHPDRRYRLVEYVRQEPVELGAGPTL